LPEPLATIQSFMGMRGVTTSPGHVYHRHSVFGSELDLRQPLWLNDNMKAAVMLLVLLCQAVVLRAAIEEEAPFDLKTLIGQTYHGCRIIKVTPEAITVSHDSGVAKIAFDVLDNEWRARFHYDPGRADAFQKEEAARRALAEEQRREILRSTARTLAGKSAVERNPMTIADGIAEQQAEAAAAGVAAVMCQPGVLVVMPGDPMPLLAANLTIPRPSTIATSSTSGPPVSSFSEVVIPPTTPLSQIYTPGVSTSQHYFINDGSVYTAGDGTIYNAYPYNPYYVNPGYIAPVYTNPRGIFCPPGASGSVVRPGGTVIHNPNSTISITPTPPRITR
jgi:hypothetical protein